MFVSSLTLSAFWSRRMRCWKLRWWPALRPTCVYSTAVNGRRRPDAVNSKHGDVTMWQTFCLCGACLLGVMCFILNLFQELKRKYKETWYFIEHVTCISNALVPRLTRFAASNVVFHLRYWWLDSNEEVSPFRGSANADYKMSGADRAVSVMCQWSEKVYAKYRSREIQFCDFERKDREITRFAFEREHEFLYLFIGRWFGLILSPTELVQDGEEWMVFSDSMKMGRLDGLDGLDVKCTVIQWCITPNHTLLYDLNPGLIWNGGSRWICYHLIISSICVASLLVHRVLISIMSYCLPIQMPKSISDDVLVLQVQQHHGLIPGFLTLRAALCKCCADQWEEGWGPS